MSAEFPVEACGMNAIAWLPEMTGRRGSVDVEALGHAPRRIGGQRAFAQGPA